MWIQMGICHEHRRAVFLFNLEIQGFWEVSGLTLPTVRSESGPGIPRGRRQEARAITVSVLGG